MLLAGQEHYNSKEFHTTLKQIVDMRNGNLSALGPGGCQNRYGLAGQPAARPAGPAAGLGGSAGPVARPAGPAAGPAGPTGPAAGPAGRLAGLACHASGQPCLPGQAGRPGPGMGAKISMAGRPATLT